MNNSRASSTKEATNKILALSIDQMLCHRRSQFLPLAEKLGQITTLCKTGHRAVQEPTTLSHSTNCNLNYSETQLACSNVEIQLTPRGESAALDQAQKGLRQTNDTSDRLREIR